MCAGEDIQQQSDILAVGTEKPCVAENKQGSRPECLTKEAFSEEEGHTGRPTKLGKLDFKFVLAC